tara:strand:+ start:25006 stop:25599 length:594 start_codon:yes stop_codon:yes gene_type:complete
MKKTFLILASILVLVSCENNKKEKESETTTVEAQNENYDDLPVLTGKQEINTIKEAPYNKWFMENYRYSPNQRSLGPLKTALTDIEMTIFMGTWCEDSRKQVPALLNILVAIQYDQSNITLITVDENKVTPEGLEEGYNIEYVPTIILYKDGEELGRIVEYPIETLEADLLAIASGEDYHHAYSDVEETSESTEENK